MDGKRWPYGDISSEGVRFSHSCGILFIFWVELFFSPGGYGRLTFLFHGVVFALDYHAIRARAIGTATSFITVSFWIGHQEDCFAVFCDWNRDSRSSRGVRFSLAAFTVKCYREEDVNWTDVGRTPRHLKLLDRKKHICIY